MTLVMILEKTKRLWFPGLLTFVEVIFLILFGLLVEYDAGGRAGHEETVANEIANKTEEEKIEDLILELESTRSTTKVYPFFQDVHVMIFVGFGFLMTFVRRYAFSSVGFNMMLAAFAIQWSTLTLGLFSFIGQSQDGASRFSISVSLESLVTSDFAAAVVLITFGAVLGRASIQQLFLIAFFEVIFYSANDALNVYVFEAADVGGSMIIHTFGAYFGLACSFVLYRKKATDHSRNSSVYHSDIFAMIGTLFLWLFWPSFNGALASGNGQYRAIINTYFAMTGSVVASYIFSIAFNGKTRKLDMSHIQNATLAGGVGIGSVADMLIGPWAALLIGFIAGTISVAGYKFLTPLLEKIRLQDTCGVHNLHGTPGILSAIASAIAAGVASSSGSKNRVNYGSSLYFTFPARAPTDEADIVQTELLLGFETGKGRSAGQQAGYQLALLASTLAISIVGGLITGGIVYLFGLLPSCKTNETEDLFDDKATWDLPDDADNYLPLTGYQPSDGDSVNGVECLEMHPLEEKEDDEEEEGKEEEKDPVEEVKEEEKDSVEEVKEEEKDSVEEVKEEEKDSVEEVKEEEKDSVEEVKEEEKDSVEEVKEEEKDPVEEVKEEEGRVEDEEEGELRIELEIEGEEEMSQENREQKDLGDRNIVIIYDV